MPCCAACSRACSHCHVAACCSRACRIVETRVLKSRSRVYWRCPSDPIRSDPRHRHHTATMSRPSNSGQGEEQPNPPPPASSECDWCQKKCTPRRCTRCYQASFCSRDCQRADWNDREKGHRNACDVIYFARRSESSGKSSDQQRPATLPASGDVEVAQAELQTILSNRLANMSMNEVQEEYYKTMDAIQQAQSILAKNDQESSGVDALDKRTKETRSKIGDGTSSDVPPATSAITQLIPSGTNSKEKAKVSSSKKPKRELSSVFDCVAGNYQCLVERLPHVSCYSITMTLRDKTAKYDSLSDRLRLSIGPDAKSKSSRVLLILESDANSINMNGKNERILLSVSLPGQILPNTFGMRLSVDDNDDSISMRLPYLSDLAGLNEEQKELNTKASIDERWANLNDGEEVAAATFSASDVKDLANLSCRSCGHRLLARDANMDGVFPLPVGCWDEVADYLTCYEGHQAFDFGSKATVADRGMILEDESIMVLNKRDLGHNVSVLAIDGYGEREEKLKGLGDAANDGTDDRDDEVPPSGFADLDAVKNGAEFRGLRKWRDSVGGATLCCSHCCTTLGFASLENVEACRLFKHRLSSMIRDEKSQGMMKNALSENTCASFLAKDMIRYAESQAVFTFVITAGRFDSNGPGECLDENDDNECILLKMLSWDTIVACSSYSENERRSTQLTRGVKIIYEFVDNYEDKIGGSSADNIDDIMSWTWGGVDLCCPPLATSKTHHQGRGDEQTQAASPEFGKASVQLFLTNEELSQVKNELLAGSRLFSEAVSTSTLLLKLGADGKKTHGDTSKGLSVILLGKVH